MWIPSCASAAQTASLCTPPPPPRTPFPLLPPPPSYPPHPPGPAAKQSPRLPFAPNSMSTAGGLLQESPGRLPTGAEALAARESLYTLLRGGGATRILFSELLSQLERQGHQMPSILRTWRLVPPPKGVVLQKPHPLAGFLHHTLEQFNRGSNDVRWTYHFEGYSAWLEKTVRPNARQAQPPVARLPAGPAPVPPAPGVPSFSG